MGGRGVWESEERRFLSSLSTERANANRRPATRYSRHVKCVQTPSPPSGDSVTRLFGLPYSETSHFKNPPWPPGTSKASLADLWHLPTFRFPGVYRRLSHQGRARRDSSHLTALSISTAKITVSATGRMSSHSLIPRGVVRKIAWRGAQ